MNAFDVAGNFFHACESCQGWAGCSDFVAEGAGFTAQCEPIADISTVEAYCEWMAGLGNGPLVGCSYDLHATAYDEASRTALFFATFNGQHTGEGGPLEPTGKATQSHYVYAIQMNEDDQVRHLTKIWNAPWALTELGWAG